MNIYEFTDYKDFLRSYIKNHQRSGITAELAQAAGCDRSYFSQTINAKAHLTPDHAVNLVEALSFREDEKGYFLLMVLHDRAANAAAKEIFRKKMQKAAQENLILTKKIRESEKPKELSDRSKARYYSNWLYGAVHILTSIKELQTVEAIANKLHIEKKMADEILNDLVEMGLVDRKSGRFTHSGANLHLSSDSPFNQLNNFLWRNRALERELVARDEVHYSTAFSLTKKDWQALKSQLISFIEKQRQFIHASGSDELYCFCCDLFSVV